MTNDELNKQIKKMPQKPGIYIFRNSQKKPLYIGKALNLKNRVKSYSRTDDSRLSKMISESDKLDYLITDSDIEALILESQYIKRYRPPFNIMLRDDKQYFYVVFTKEKFPKIFLTHQPRQKIRISNIEIRNKSKIQNPKSQLSDFGFRASDLYSVPTEYIGPFTDGSAIKTTLRLLRRVFPYCTCKQLHNNYCLNYHIGNCPGFCCLKQQNPNLKFTTHERNEWSSNPESQRAEQWSHGHRRMTKNQSEKSYDKNVKAIRNILNGRRKSLIKNFEKEMKNLSAKQDYERALELQYKISKLERVFQNATIIENLKLKIENYPGQKKNSAVAQLQQVLKLEHLPARIEAYDVANIQGKHAVGSMVVFVDGRSDRNQYRKFRIRNLQITNHKHQITNKSKIPNSKFKTGGDTAMLREILIRRLNHSEWPYPDLIIVDGGKAQLNTAKEVLRIMNSELRIIVIALTKNERHIGHKVMLGNNKEILLAKIPPETRNLLLRLDTEAHRFAIAYYRKIHRGSI